MAHQGQRVQLPLTCRCELELWLLLERAFQEIVRDNQVVEAVAQYLELDHSLG